MTNGNTRGLSKVNETNARLPALSRATPARPRTKPVRKAQSLVALNLSMDNVLVDVPFHEPARSVFKVFRHLERGIEFVP